MMRRLMVVSSENSLSIAALLEAALGPPLLPRAGGRAQKTCRQPGRHAVCAQVEELSLIRSKPLLKQQLGAGMCVKAAQSWIQVIRASLLYRSPPSKAPLLCGHC